MACKYVKDFSFPSEAGFTGSAGQKHVSGYMRGGAVEKAEPVKKSLGGIVKTLISPLEALASGDAPKGIGALGALGGVAGLLLEDKLRKKKARQPVVAPTTDVVAPTTDVVAPQMRRGGKVGVPAHNRVPMFGRKD